jgi:hypothetical protein
VSSPDVELGERAVSDSPSTASPNAASESTAEQTGAEPRLLSADPADEEGDEQSAPRRGLFISNPKISAKVAMWVHKSLSTQWMLRSSRAL